MALTQPSETTVNPVRKEPSPWKWSPGVWNSIRLHALKAYPRECCGLLLAEGDTVVSCQPMQNVHPGDRRRRFALDPKEYMRLELRALHEDKTVAGIYHSHPDHPAVPSEEDLKFAMEGLSYPIVAVDRAGESYVRCWRLDDDRFFEEIVD